MNQRRDWGARHRGLPRGRLRRWYILAPLRRKPKERPFDVAVAAAGPSVVQSFHVHPRRAMPTPSADICAFATQGGAPRKYAATIPRGWRPNQVEQQILECW